MINDDNTEKTPNHANTRRVRRSADELAPYFRVSFDYAKTLKPKATKRAPTS